MIAREAGGRSSLDEDQGRISTAVFVSCWIVRKPCVPDEGDVMLDKSVMTAPSDLFQPVRLGPYHLANRIVMAPLTRSRAGEDGLATPLMAEYYAQRASAGLIIAEGTNISPHGGRATSRCLMEGLSCRGS